MIVKLFARARELAGSGTIDVELGAGATVSELRHKITAGYPALGSLLERSAIAVNGEFADDALTLPSNPEIAVLPPVSGG